MPKRALLINPWIYDFKAFDFWTKPLGLLYLASILRNQAWQTDYLDCLDRYHPVLLEQVEKLPKVDQYGRGKFYAEVIPKPQIYHNYPRRYKRYGIPEFVFKQIVDALPKPDWIFVTSIMTYWYPGVFDTIKILKQYFPKTPVILGGIYATLCPEHARQFSKADYVIEGMAEQKLSTLIPELKPFEFTALPYPAFDLYHKLDYACILTSRGCCFNCIYCAVPNLTPGFAYRTVDSVINEIKHYQDMGIKNIAFYDDALLANPNFSSILDQLIEQKIKINFHSPNGLHPRFFTQELSDKMFRAGFKTIYLSLETASPCLHEQIDNKVSTQEFLQTVKFLKRSGFNSNQIHAYLLIGLAQIVPDEIRKSIDFVHDQGIISHLAEYSPIPNTRGFEELKFDKNTDPLLHNNAIFPGLDEPTRQQVIEIKAYHSRLRHTF
ncbi:MAG: radical SAM protein [Candidatus Latescibacteria bacterium]|nr:radical SAM protein [Candidatus Latescibacterota bacterium]